MFRKFGGDGAEVHWRNARRGEEIITMYIARHMDDAIARRRGVNARIATNSVVS